MTIDEEFEIIKEFVNTGEGSFKKPTSKSKKINMEMMLI